MTERTKTDKRIEERERERERESPWGESQCFYIQKRVRACVTSVPVPWKTNQTNKGHGAVLMTPAALKPILTTLASSYHLCSVSTALCEYLPSCPRRSPSASAFMFIILSLSFIFTLQAMSLFIWFPFIRCFQSVNNKPFWRRVPAPLHGTPSGTIALLRRVE